MPTQFVGRQGELSDLVERLERATAGAGDVVLIRADAGIGKSRLCGEVIAVAAARGVACLTGHCLEGGGIPYLPFGEIVEDAIEAFGEAEVFGAAGSARPDLASIAPVLRDGAGSPLSRRVTAVEPERHALFALFRDFLGRLSQVSPLFILIEDVHWADEATALLVRYLTRTVKARRVLIVLTCRTEERSVGGTALAQLLADVGRHSTGAVLALPELPVHDVATMIAGLTGREPPDHIASALYERVGGNPLFVEQVVKHLIEGRRLFDERQRWIELTSFDTVPLPDSIRDAIAQRLERLSPESGQVLTVAAVAGRRVEFELLCDVTGLSPSALVDALDAAEQSHLIVAERTQANLQVTFRHDLIRAGILDRTSLLKQQALHLAVARALEVREETAVVHAQELAYHYLASRSRQHMPAALRYLRLAAERAVAAGAFEDAARLYAEGLELVPVSDAAARCEMLLLLGEARKRVSDSDLARSAFDEGARLAAALDDYGLYARAALGYARSWPTVGSVDERAVQLLSSALGLVPADQLELRAQLMSRHALQTLYGGEPAAVLQRARDAVAVARTAANPVTLARSLQVLHVALWQPDQLTERLAVATEIIDLAATINSPNIQMWGIRPRIADLMEQGDVAAADADSTTYEHAAAASRQPLYLWQCAVRKAMIAIFRGQLDEGERIAQRALELGRQAEGQNLLAAFGGQLLIIRWQQGRIAELRPLIETSRRNQPEVALWAAVLAFIESESGDHAAARALFEELARDRFEAASREDSGLVVLVLSALVCGALGDGLRADQLYERLRPYDGRNIVVSEGVACVGAAGLYLGMLSATARRFDDAEAHLRQAAQFNAENGGRPWAAHAEFELARVLLARRRGGDRRTARELLRRALGVARDTGMRRLQDRIEETVRSHKKLSSERPDGLTPRECEVLRLVAQGLSTSEVSERLVLSERTTARHITNIYAKIGARNRVEATAYAFRHLVQG